MAKASIIHLVLALLAMLAPSAFCHTFFIADVTEAPGASLVGYTHTGIFLYNLTSNATDKIASAALVDSTKNIVVALENPVATGSTDVLAATSSGYVPKPPAYASFDASSIQIAIPKVYGEVYDLFQLVCAGEIMLMIKTTDGKDFMAPMKYRAPLATPGEPVETCAEGAQPYVAAAPAPAPAPSAAVRPATAFAFALSFLAIAVAALP